ncbi:MAG: hypothetical protein WD738_23940 [Pirellulales bacterium]
MNATTPLTEVIDRYIDDRNQERPIGRELSADYCEQLYETARVYGHYLKRAANCGDFSPSTANEYLRWMMEDGYSPYTMKTRRTGLRVLWRFAKREGVMTGDPDGLRRVYCPRLEPKGYSMAAMQQLLSFAAKLIGVVRGTGVPRRIYWTAMIVTMWNVGCRIGDIGLAETGKFDPTGRLWLLEGKTGKARWHRLHSVTTAAIAGCVAANPGRDRIWPGYTRTNIVRAFTRLAKSAGVGGTSKYIRRGSSSALDRLQPGQGWRFLNHSDPRVFEQHYRDADICQDESLAPPELPCGDEILSLYRPKEKVERGRAQREAKPPAKRVYANATDVPLTREVREALAHHPMEDSHLAVLVGHLAAHGIRARQLAEWWGVAFKRYQDFRYGYRIITIQAADRLRRAFDLPIQGVVAEGAIKLGSLPTTPVIEALLNDEQFGAAELRSISDYAKTTLGVKKWRLAESLGISGGYLVQMCSGTFPVTATIQPKLRDLFTFEQAVRKAAASL